MTDQQQDQQLPLEPGKAPEVVPPPPKAGGLVSQRDLEQIEKFNGVQSSALTNLAAVQVAEQSRALIEARCIMALKRPRDLDVVRQKLLKDCERPGFAKRARFEKPVAGQKVRGWTIRFAEGAMRAMGNMDSDAAIIYEDAERRLVRVTTIDLEANTSESTVVSVNKTIERKKPADDGSYISWRNNSRGEMVYLLPATEDDLLTKTNNLVAKAKRNGIVHQIPADLLDEAEETVKETMLSKATEDPEAERKKIADAFASIGVSPLHLKEYLGHELSGTTPAELVDLRGVYAAIRDGEAKWSDFVAAAKAEEGSRTEQLKKKMAEKKANGDAKS